MRRLGRFWMPVVLVVVVAVTAVALYRLQGIFGSDNEVSRPGSAALENTGYNAKVVLLEVLGSAGTNATITYLDTHAQPQQIDNERLPWSTTLVTDDPTLYADLRAQGDGDAIRCRITVNGIVKDERSSNNVNGYISCLDKTA